MFEGLPGWLWSIRPHYLHVHLHWTAINISEFRGFTRRILEINAKVPSEYPFYATSFIKFLSFFSLFPWCLLVQGVSLDELEILRVVYGIFPTYRNRYDLDIKLHFPDNKWEFTHNFVLVHMIASMEVETLLLIL